MLLEVSLSVSLVDYPYLNIDDPGIVRSRSIVMAGIAGPVNVDVIESPVLRVYIAYLDREPCINNSSCS